MMVERRAAAGEMARTGEQRAGTVCRGRGLAQGGTPAGTRAAMPAARDEDQNRVVALGEAVDVGADLLDHGRRLVAQHHRSRSRPRSVDHGEVRVAEARCRNAHQHLTGTRRRQVHLGNGQGAGRGIGRGATHLLEHGSANAHGPPLCSLVRATPAPSALRYSVGSGIQLKRAMPPSTATVVPVT